MPKDTIKIITIRKIRYIAVWKKGRRGMFLLRKKKKGVTLKSTRELLKVGLKKEIKELPATVFRIVQALLYFYAEDTKVGQIRLVVHTLKPSKFNSRTMKKLLSTAESIAIKRIPKFKRALQVFVDHKRTTAREERVIEVSEFRRSKADLDTVNVEIAGLGLTHKGRATIRFKF